MIIFRSPLCVLIPASFSVHVSGCARSAHRGDTAALVGNAREGVSMEKMMTAWGDAGAVGENHEPLDQLTGTWDTASKFWMQPNATPMEIPGESTKILVLGGRFVREEHQSNDPKMSFEGIGYTGYDNIKQKYIGSWIDSMTTFMFTSESSPTDDGFEGGGSMYDPLTESWYESRLELTIASKDSHKLEYWEPGPGGDDYLAMQIMYTRRASEDSVPTLSVSIQRGEPEADGARPIIGYVCGGSEETLNLTQLEQNLRKEAGLVAPIRVLDYAGRNDKYDELVPVLDACHKAGISDVRVARR